VLRDIRLCVVYAGGGFVSVLQSETIQAVLKFGQGQLTSAGYSGGERATVDAVKSMVHCWRCAGYVSIWACGVDADAAGAFWRVKQDKPASFSMLTDSRFLLAFLIPVLMHTLWT